MSYKTSQDFIEECPVISALTANKLLHDHGQSMTEYLHDNPVETLFESESVLGWLGY